ncbi:MAG: hypothetical protein V1750_07970 [Acidobacteriota bacterium]
MKTKSLFSESDHEAIRRAVVEVEKRTAGEIVPFVVGACDDYDGASWRAATLGTTLAALVTVLVHELGGFWGGWFAVWLLAPVLGGGIFGYLAGAFFPVLRRRLTDPATIDARVRLRAETAFLREEVFATAERTGILIFLTLLERRVVILGDSGINAKVQQHEWDEIVAGIAAGIRAGRPTHALIEGIGRCGELLQRRVEIRPEDRDELSDALRISDR